MRIDRDDAPLPTSWGARLRNHFVTGLVVVGELGAASMASG